MKKTISKLIILILVFALASTGLSGITFGETKTVDIKDISGIKYVFDATLPKPYWNKNIESENFLTIDKEIAYCLDFGTRIDEDFLERESRDDYDSLDDEQKELLQLALSLGFSTADSDSVTDFTDYFVTQVAIWLITSKHFNTDYEDDIIAVFFSNITECVTKYEKLKAEILAAKLYPSFNGQVIALSYNATSKKYEVTLTDTNKVLTQYTVADEYKKIATINPDNTLTLVMDKPEMIDITMTRAFKPGSLIYWIDTAKQPASQAIISGDKNSDSITASIKTTILEQIEIEKTGEALVGVNTDKTAFGTIYKTVYKEKQPLEGVKFQVITLEDVAYMEKGELVTKKANSILCEMTTDAKGKAISDPFPMFIEFKLKEVSGNGYIANYEEDFFHYDVKRGIYSLKLDNARQKLNITFQKSMELGIGKNTKPYEEVMFGVFTEGQITSGKFTIPADSLVALVTPDSAGNAQVNDLLAGKYYLKELKTAPGYKLDETEYLFELKYDSDKDSEITISVNNGEPIDNDIIKGKAKVKKTDKSGKGLAGAVFELYTEDGYFVAEIESDAKGNTPEIDLTYGRYYWIETKAPAGCKLDKTKHYFEVIEDGFVYEITIKNYSNSVKTGDESSFTLWISLSLCSAFIMWYAYRRKNIALNKISSEGTTLD